MKNFAISLLMSKRLGLHSLLHVGVFLLLLKFLLFGSVSIGVC